MLTNKALTYPLAGLATIVTNTAGQRVCHDLGDGARHAPGDVRALAAGLKRCLADPMRLMRATRTWPAAANAGIGTSTRTRCAVGAVEAAVRWILLMMDPSLRCRRGIAAASSASSRSRGIAARAGTRSRSGRPSSHAREGADFRQVGEWSRWATSETLTVTGRFYAKRARSTSFTASAGWRTGRRPPPSRRCRPTCARSTRRTCARWPRSGRSECATAVSRAIRDTSSQAAGGMSSTTARASSRPRRCRRQPRARISWPSRTLQRRALRHRRRHAPRRRLVIAGNISTLLRNASTSNARSPHIDGKLIQFVGTVDDGQKTSCSARRRAAAVEWGGRFVMSCGTCSAEPRSSRSGAAACRGMNGGAPVSSATAVDEWLTLSAGCRDRSRRLPGRRNSASAPGHADIYERLYIGLETGRGAWQ